MRPTRTNHFLPLLVDMIRGARVVSICGIVVALLFAIPAAEFHFNSASVDGTIVRIMGDATSVQTKAVISFVDTEGVAQVFTNGNAGALSKGQVVKVHYRVGKANDARVHSPWMVSIAIFVATVMMLAISTFMIQLLKSD